ncbi:leukocyte immunoglobulin-like receptor subfamily B member 2 [Gallus gallus]|uniref:leukocyte immunoglobulin-like receptor subfamily B member 2 n=1 Tax=Gallus gallus TaxID=9031 RepID=UPI001EFFC5EE|nr:leukocyte immunoglobulin-like receptor subfamily B member 2 [Gallus gallus]
MAQKTVALILAAWVRLYRYQNPAYIEQKDNVQDMAEFSLAGIKQVDAVRYQCQYQGLEPAEASEKSDPVELLVTDHRYPPPGISLSPREYVKMETNITIQCWNQEYRGTIFLHKDGHSAPIQHQEPDGGGTATFTLFRVTLADSGTYRCSYRVGGSYLLSSPLGDNVTPWGNDLSALSGNISPVSALHPSHLFSSQLLQAASQWVGWLVPRHLP